MSGDLLARSIIVTAYGEINPPSEIDDWYERLPKRKDGCPDYRFKDAQRFAAWEKRFLEIVAEWWMAGNELSDLPKDVWLMDNG